VKAGLDTLITGEADYPTEVKARELGINLILCGHQETEVFGVRNLAKSSQIKDGRTKKH
jgi:putative NIF3 family GTP cyclohydrolase 1 type 2